MSFTTSVRIVEGVVIIDLAGRLTLGEATGKIRESVKAALQTGTNVIINLAQVPYMDSAGLGELVGAYTSVAGRGGTMKLLHPQGRLRDLLQLTKLVTVFETFEDEQAAVRSYAKGAGM